MARALGQFAVTRVGITNPFGIDRIERIEASGEDGRGARPLWKDPTMRLSSRGATFAYGVLVVSLAGCGGGSEAPANGAGDSGIGTDAGKAVDGATTADGGVST